MKKRALFVLATAILLTAPLAGALAADTETLTGKWIWNHRDNNGTLEAVFTPTGEGEWDVDFHFNFRDKPHTYSGTAEGSLSGGTLEGEVKNESKERTFIFSGMVNEDGTFEGTHAETTGDRKDNTGTLVLKR